MGNDVELKDGYGIHAHPEHFEIGYALCAGGNFSKGQAMVMAKGFDKRGLIDASAGCMHYILRLICANQ